MKLLFSSMLFTYTPYVTQLNSSFSCAQKLIICAAHDAFETVLRCDNRDKKNETLLPCEYQRIIGTNYSKTAVEHMEISEKIEMAIKVILNFIQNNFCFHSLQIGERKMQM